MSALKYRPEIDGLRAVAVIPVVLFHLGAAWIPGGFVGVDVFFVISGFLITSIILKEQAAGVFTFSGFWMRRARRILPAMLSMLIATSIAGYFILFGPSWKELGYQVISAVGLYANIEMWQLSGSYWGPVAETAPLLHTWSLSVEEQFYLFYPLLLLLLLKFTPKRVFPIILAGSAISLAVGVYATSYHASAAFYFLPPRAWELAAGCLLAIFESQRGPAPRGNISRTLAFAGLLLITAGYFIIQGEVGFPGFWALLPVVGTVLVIRFSSGEKCLAGRILGWGPAVYIGKCSYSLYLWHWPVIVLGGIVQLRHPGEVSLGGVVLLITILSLSSYHFIEKPTRKMVRVLPLVFGALVVSLGLAVFLLRADYKYDTSKLEPTEWFGRLYDASPPTPREPGRTRMDGIVLADREKRNEDSMQGIVLEFGAERPAVVVLGSSHANMWGNTIAGVCEELGLTVSMFGANGTPPWIDFPVKGKASKVFSVKQKKDFDTQRLKCLKEWTPEIVIIAHRWSLGTDPFQYLKFLHYIESCGSQVIFMEQPPELPIGDVNAPQYLVYRYPELAFGSISRLVIARDRDNQEQKGGANSRILELCQFLDFCHFLPMSDLYEVSTDEVLVVDDGRVLYIDDDHLSEAGAQMGRGRIKQKIIEILREDEKDD